MILCDIRPGEGTTMHRLRPPAAGPLARGVLAGALAFGGALDAQCAPDWRSAVPSPGTDGVVHATTMWDRDGAGPHPPVLVVGGEFSVAGDALARNVAVYDPADGRWSALGDDLHGTVQTLAVLPSGELHAGGDLPGGNVQRWTGTSWESLAFGPGGTIYDMAIKQDGTLLAGGAFANSSTGVRGVACWDGAAWQPLGDGIGTGSPADIEIVRALAVLPNGDVIAGGDFTTAGGAPANSIARWNGVSWSALGAGPNDGIRTLRALPNGELLAGGWFTAIDGVPAAYAARWDGVSWHAMPGLSNSVWSFDQLPMGDIIAGGLFNVGGLAQTHVARWDGTSWTAVGDGLGYWITTVTVTPAGELIAAGDFTASTGARSVARWDGAAWTPLSVGALGFDDDITAIEVLPDGSIAVGGSFQDVDGVTVNHVAITDGVSWSALTTGTIGGQPDVYCLQSIGSGDLIVGGSFASAGGVTAQQGIALWDGASWREMPGWQPGITRTLFELPDATVLAGATAVQRWNGQSWSQMGQALVGARAFALLPNGALAAGCHSQFGATFRRWNGIWWEPWGPPLDGNVNALVVDRNGDLIAGGSFRHAGALQVEHVARWNGTTWSPLAGGIPLYSVHALTLLPNGDILAGAGSYAVQRWDGAQWSVVQNEAGPSVVRALASSPDGDVLVGGDLGHATGARFVRLSTTCPASVTPFGAGCAGSGGLDQLAAATLPWIGSTFVADATGMPDPAFVISVQGFQPVAVPLASILPVGVPGCELLVSPDILGAQVSTNGSATIALPIPPTMSLVGQVQHLQAVALGIDANLAFTELTSSNALTFVIGSL